MPVVFATPIAHQTNSNYAAFNNAYAVGRAFRQPLDSDPNAAQFAPGLEIFCDPAGAAADLFAFLEGDLRWQAATVAAPGDNLLLDVAASVLFGEDNFSGFRILEAPPARVVYGNVDAAAVQTELVSLLTGAYNAAAGKPVSQWHPVMAMKVIVNGAEIRLRKYIQQHQPTATVVPLLVAGFVAGGANAILRRVPVRTGERIGRAAPYLAADPPPAAPPFPLGAVGDPNRARRLTFQTIDRGDQFINPLYYLQLLMRRLLLAQQPPPTVLSVTDLVLNGALNHPLATLYPQLTNPQPLTARSAVGGVSAFRLGELRNYHGHGSSRLEWRYTNTLVFEARDKAALPNIAPPPMASTSDSRQRVRTVWNNWGQQISDISQAFQVPAEPIVALLCAESLPSLDERVVRLEPLLDADRNRVRADAAVSPLEAAYDKAAGSRGVIQAMNEVDANHVSFDIRLDDPIRWRANALVERRRVVLWGTERLRITANTGSNVATRNYTITMMAPSSAQAEAWVLDGWSPPAPGIPGPGWPGAHLVHPAAQSASALTWDDLVLVVRATGGTRISPGVLQTLISTAIGAIPWINAVAPTIYGTIGVAAPPVLPNGNPDAGGYLNDWLIQGINSILVGSAYIRISYNQAASKFDLPLVGSTYNAGYANGWPKQVAKSLWGLRYFDLYVERAGPHNNALVEYFHGAQPPAVLPAVGFQP